MRISDKKSEMISLLYEVAEVLGGAQVIKSLKTLKLYGYAQYAYMWGGGNISASPFAPQKLIAANELQRVWDFDAKGFQMKERRNMLFPFAAKFGHSFFPLNQILVGNIAFDKLPDGSTARVGEFAEDPLTIDGRRIRRLWSLMNPISMLYALLNEEVKVQNLHFSDDIIEFDIKTPEDDELVFGIDAQTKIPQFVSWNTPQTNLGEVNFKTTFTGYMPFSGIKLPMGYTTYIDFRNVIYFKMFVDGYKINEATEGFVVPQNIAEKVEPDIQPVVPLSVEKEDDGIWRIGGIGGTTVIEFADHLCLFELYWSWQQAKAIIEKANTLVPNKKVHSLIISHHHFDHTGGFRAAVAAGLKIYANRENEAILREMAERKTPHFKDVLANDAPRDFEFIPVDEHLCLEDSQTKLDIYRVISNNHMADAVFAYLPDKEIFMDSDIATAAYDWQLWPDSYMDNLAYYGLKVKKVSTVHEKVMTHEEILKYIADGLKRTYEREKESVAVGEYLPGYPIFRTRR